MAVYPNFLPLAEILTFSGQTAKCKVEGSKAVNKLFDYQKKAGQSINFGKPAVRLPKKADHSNKFGKQAVRLQEIRS